MDIYSLKNIRKPQTTGLKRNTVDKYYTCSNIAETCVSLLNEHIEINDDDLCIEPSAGNGSFIKPIQDIFSNYLFYDISPEHEDIIKQDFLIYDPSNIQHCYPNIHIIGNPPFGRQSSLAIKFIKKSCSFCESLSFILPRSFKKDSMKKHIPLNFHLICQYDIPKNSFIIDSNSYDVPCVFQIWIKRDIQRTLPKKQKPNKYTFVKKNEPHDISFRRVGVYAGKIDTKTDTKSPQSHYFIKFEKELTNDILDKLNSIDYTSKDDTVGPRSISKQELIKEFNSII